MYGSQEDHLVHPNPPTVFAVRTACSMCSRPSASRVSAASSSSLGSADPRSGVSRARLAGHRVRNGQQPHRMSRLRGPSCPTAAAHGGASDLEIVTASHRRRSDSVASAYRSGRRLQLTAFWLTLDSVKRVRLAAVMISAECALSALSRAARTMARTCRRSRAGRAAESCRSKMSHALSLGRDCPCSCGQQSGRWASLSPTSVGGFGNYIGCPGAASHSTVGWDAAGIDPARVRSCCSFGDAAESA